MKVISEVPFFTYLRGGVQERDFIVSTKRKITKVTEVETHVLIFTVFADAQISKQS